MEVRRCGASRSLRERPPEALTHPADHSSAAGLATRASNITILRSVRINCRVQAPIIHSATGTTTKYNIQFDCDSYQENGSSCLAETRSTLLEKRPTPKSVSKEAIILQPRPHPCLEPTNSHLTSRQSVFHLVPTHCNPSESCKS